MHLISISKTALRKAVVLVFMALFTVSLSAQNMTLEGVVLDEADQPMIGCGVLISGTTTGTVTDLDGKFSIGVKKGQKVTFSSLGYQAQEMTFNGQNNVTIKLVPDTQLLDEIVVVGYGTMKKSDLTGAVASVDAEAIQNFKTSSVMESLGGQIAGLQITQSDGTPGSGFSVNIRGVGTMNGDASPLYIVDGFQVDDISFISQSDIESIEALKDASSAAIYGSRAANGVLMITTKQGKKGRPIVSYNGSATYRVISKELDVLSPYEFVQLQGEIKKESLDSYYKQNTAEETFKYTSLEDYLNVDPVNWQAETFNPTWSQDHSVSLTGGTDQTKYSANFAYYDEQGIFNNSGFTKTTGKISLNQKLWKNVTLDLNVNYAQTNRRGTGTTADNGRFNMLAQILSARPTGGLKLTNEELLESAIDPEMLESGESLAQVNPVKQTQSVTNTKRADQWSARGSLTWEIIKGLTFKTAGTYTNTFTRNNTFYKNGSKEAYRNGEKPYGRSQMNRDVRWVNYNQLTWKQKIKKHNYSVMLGHEASFSSTEWILGEAMDFPFDNLENNNLGLGATPSKVDSEYNQNALLSFFTRVDYNYAGKYIFQAVLRADGSTKFSANNKWGFFPSVSAAWRISEEPFLKDVDWLSNLKLRAGWGQVGNDRISNYLSLDLYTDSKYGVGNQVMTVLTPKQLRNSDLRWEGSTSTNIGIDASFFNNRLNLVFDMFNKDTRDLLLAQQLAHATGFSTQMRNIGKIRNQGIEITLSSTNIDKKNFLWQTSLNISFLRNTLRELADGAKYVQTRTGFDSNFTSNDYIAIIGQSLGLMYGYEFDGLYQYDDFYTTPEGKYILKPGVVDNPGYSIAGANDAANKNNPNKGVQPGVVKYKDQDGDGVITTNDRTVIGCGIPTMYGGITNTFSFYGVDFSFMFQFNYGNDVYNATRMFATQSRLGRKNFLGEVADRWTPSHTATTVPKYDGYVTNDVYSRFVEDGSFLRLKNVTLGYTFPKKWTEKAKISRLRVYATAQNLFVISNYSGYDPEVSTMANNPMTPSVDWGAYPKSRMFTIGLDLQF